MTATTISPAETAKVLGGRKVFRRDIRSAKDLIVEIARGFPVSSLRFVLSAMMPTGDKLPERLVSNAPAVVNFRDKIVPTGTYKRRVAAKRLSSAESERLERVARVFATARHVLESDDVAREFLHTPHPELGGQPPIDLAVSELGARQIETILWGVYFGIPA